MRNDQYSALLNRIADLQEIRGEMFFKVRSYREAARQIDELGEPVDTLRAEGRLSAVHGIGKAIAEKLNEYGDTGKLEFLDRLEAEVPPGLLDFLRIPGLGPRTAKDIYDALGITTLEGLQQALDEGGLSGVPRMGAKSQDNIRKGLEALRGRGRGMRTLLPKALAVADQFVNALRALPQVDLIEPAGSLRRRAESIGDLDLVVASTEPSPIMDAFCNLGMVSEVLAQGETKSSIRTREGLQVDLRVVAPEHFGAALVYFTGSKAHNVRMRSLALRLGLTLNEYGLARLAEGEEAGVLPPPAGGGVGEGPKTPKRSRAVQAHLPEELPSATEEQVYNALGLAWIPPYLREDRGELDLAASGKLPSVLTREEIRGDFHVHSNNSDGKAAIAEMVDAAVKRGYGYIAITDHSRSQGIITGIPGNTYRDQIARVREEAKAAAKSHKGFRLLAGVEVNILPDGTLDVPDEILAELDVVVASVHSQFRMDRAAMTARMCKAVMSPHVDILGHATGRKIETRDPYEVDLEQVLQAAVKGHTAVEINASPQRLDVNDVYARRARDLGLLITIDSDGHSQKELDQMEYGVYVAQRAWLTKDDVINCWEIDRVLAHFGAK